jgi:hypothetical protein
MNFLSDEARISKPVLHWVLLLAMLFFVLLSSLRAQPAGYEHRK